jgi:hypothetical protein
MDQLNSHFLGSVHIVESMALLGKSSTNFAIQSEKGQQHVPVSILSLYGVSQTNAPRADSPEPDRGPVSDRRGTPSERQQSGLDIGVPENA